MATGPAIRIEGLSKSFGRTPALQPLTLEVATGEVLGYLGPNGAGKTTTIRLLLGLIQPTGGRAEIFGLDCHRQTVATHRSLAYIPGEANLWPQLTGIETLHLLGRIHGQCDEAYRDALIARFQLDPTKRVRAYSKGNRQKLVLIAALMTRASLLIMDEPTSGLDPLMEAAFRTSVHEAIERGQTVFLSSHILSEVEALCTRVAILRAGQLIEVGTLAEMRHLSALTIEIDFEGPPPDLASVPGVSAVTTVPSDTAIPQAATPQAATPQAATPQAATPQAATPGSGVRVHCQVAGSIEPLLQVLATARVRRLVSREPSLEELFLSHYGAPVSHG